MTTALTERRELAHRRGRRHPGLEPGFGPVTISVFHARSADGARIRGRRRRRARCLQPPLRLRDRRHTPHRYAARGDEPVSVATDRDLLRRSRARHPVRRSDVACAAGSGVGVGVVEGIERVGAVDLEFERRRGARVENGDRDPARSRLQTRVTSTPSVVRWASSRRSVSAVVIAAPPLRVLG